ncbi:MAG TPA: hypothetical protein VMV31_09125 [Terriglobales bacterium]|nr:hypothetical protein [Terriglobales bacterium]
MNREPQDDPNVAELMASLAPPPASEPDRARAWERFRRRRLATPLPPPAPWRRRPAWVAAGAAAALVGALGFSPRARSATARMLSLFRVNQVAALPFDAAGAPAADRSVRRMIAQLMRDEVTVTRNEPNLSAANIAQASQLAGFAVRYAPYADASAAPAFRVQGGKDFQLTLDRARAQAILDAAGLGAQPLPPSLEGATIAVHLPRTVAVMYGPCAQWAAHSRGGFDAPPPTAGCTVLGEGPSPEVSLPPGLDMQQLAVLGLQLLGMTPEQAQQYCQTIDWTSTLVVPFPRGQAQSRPVAVDGVQGILLTRARPGQVPHYVLLWSRQGMLYSIVGAGDGSQGLSLAGELTN